jgi:hypothetical protein
MPSEFSAGFRAGDTSLDFHERVFGPPDVARLLGTPLIPSIFPNGALAVSMTDFSVLTVLSRSQTLCFNLPFA